MRVVKVLVLVVHVLLSIAACGGSRDSDMQSHTEGQDGSEGVVSPSPSLAVMEPTAVPGPTSPSVDPEVAPAEPSEPTILPDQVAAPTEALVGEPPTEAPESGAPPPTREPQPPGDEFTFDPAIWEQDLIIIGTFRQKVVLDFAADTGVNSRVTYEGEITTDPSALHSIVRVGGQGAARLPGDQVEVIWIGEQVWVKVGRRPWVQIPASAVESQFSGQVVGVSDLLPFVQQASRVMPDETVNGIPCKHYLYDIANLQTEAGMSSAQGDIWVAKDGGYVVRLTMEGQGIYYDTYSASGTLNLIYDLYDLDAPISIKPPR